jgi:hypothetical protein
VDSITLSLFANLPTTYTLRAPGSKRTLQGKSAGPSSNPWLCLLAMPLLWFSFEGGVYHVEIPEKASVADVLPLISTKLGVPLPWWLLSLMKDNKKLPEDSNLGSLSSSLISPAVEVGLPSCPELLGAYFRPSRIIIFAAFYFWCHCLEFPKHISTSSSTNGIPSDT